MVPARRAVEVEVPDHERSLRASSPSSTAITSRTQAGATITLAANGSPGPTSGPMIQGRSWPLVGIVIGLGCAQQVWRHARRRGRAERRRRGRVERRRRAWTWTVAAGRSTVALRSDGVVRCWGESDGALGDGTWTRMSPVTVSGLTDAVGITAGTSTPARGCGTARARCWGRNDLGAVGDGTTTDRVDPHDGCRAGREVEPQHDLPVHLRGATRRDGAVLGVSAAATSATDGHDGVPDRARRGGGPSRGRGRCGRGHLRMAPRRFSARAGGQQAWSTGRWNRGRAASDARSRG